MIEILEIKSINEIFNNVSIIPKTICLGESPEHGVLKNYAEYIIMKRYSHFNIKTVREFMSFECGDVGHTIIDVVGISDNFNVAVECGTTTTKKLEKLSAHYDHVITIPYKYLYPYSGNCFPDTFIKEISDAGELCLKTHYEEKKEFYNNGGMYYSDLIKVANKLKKGGNILETTNYTYTLGEKHEQ